jgi:hypothetical protein
MASCFACDKVLGKHDDTVTTDSGFTLHRACLKKLLDTESKANDQVCERSLSLSICSYSKNFLIHLCTSLNRRIAQFLNWDHVFNTVCSIQINITAL